MGKGVARQFKEREPKMFQAYKRLCDEGKLEPGKLWLWRGTDCWTLNFPTKIHWKNPSKLEWVEAGLAKFVSGYERLAIYQISFPRLGCGNGGLDWDDVRPLMEHYLAPLPIQIFIHDHTVDIGIPEHLEDAAKTLKAEQSAERSFESFVDSLRRTIDLAGDKLVDIQTRQPFSASMLDENQMRIDEGSKSWTFEQEHLRGVWASWPAPGSEDTELGVLLELEVGHGEAEVYARVQA